MSAAIRPLAETDLPALRAVIDANGLFPSEMLGAMCAPFLAGGEDALWFVVDHGAPSALAYAAPERMTDGTWNLLLIAVHPARHGQGQGGALTRHIERALAARGGRILLVETSGLAEFERTRAVYRKLGYEEEACIREFYAAGEDKIVFRKALNQPG